MATRYWIGKADAVAQQDTGSIDTVDATPSNNTFTITIGGVAVSVPGNTDAPTTAADLVAAANGSTHPYFAAITWSVPAGSQVRGIGDIAGVPFIASLTVSGGGTGTVTDFANDTPASGPNDWSTAENWSGGVVPVSTDDVVIENSAVNIAWGLDQNAVTLASLTVKKTYTGRIGLNRRVFAQSSDAQTTTTAAKDEYREDYLRIGADEIALGEHFGAGAPAGSGRIKLDNTKAGASELVVHDTALTAAETNQASVKYLAANAAANITVRAAPGGFGVAVDDPTEVSTIGTIRVVDTTPQSRINCGPGVTLTNWEQDGGQNTLDLAANLTLAEVRGGTLVLDGAFAVTTLTLDQGTVEARNVPTAGNAIGTANVNGGTLDMTETGVAQTIGSVVLGEDATLDGSDLVTITSGTYNGGNLRAVSS